MHPDASICTYMPLPEHPARLRTIIPISKHLFNHWRTIRRPLETQRKNTLSNFTARTASLALALIALPLTAAHAQPSVRFGDLNLASDAGKAAFAHRVDVAADQAC